MKIERTTWLFFNKTIIVAIHERKQSQLVFGVEIFHPTIDSVDNHKKYVWTLNKETEREGDSWYRLHVSPGGDRYERQQNSPPSISLTALIADSVQNRLCVSVIDLWMSQSQQAMSSVPVGAVSGGSSQVEWSGWSDTDRGCERPGESSRFRNPPCCAL